MIQELYLGWKNWEKQAAAGTKTVFDESWNVCGKELFGMRKIFEGCASNSVAGCKTVIYEMHADGRRFRCDDFFRISA